MDNPITVAITVFITASALAMSGVILILAALIYHLLKHITNLSTKMLAYKAAAEMANTTLGTQLLKCSPAITQPPQPPQDSTTTSVQLTPDVIMTQHSL